MNTYVTGATVKSIREATPKPVCSCGGTASSTPIATNTD